MTRSTYHGEIPYPYSTLWQPKPVRVELDLPDGQTIGGLFLNPVDAERAWERINGRTSEDLELWSWFIDAYHLLPECVAEAASAWVDTFLNPDTISDEGDGGITRTGPGVSWWCWLNRLKWLRHRVESHREVHGYMQAPAKLRQLFEDSESDWLPG